MSLLPHERYCDEILTQTDAFRAALRGADPGTTVPTCPDWSLAQLVLHVSGAQRGAAAIVRDRIQEFTIPTTVAGEAPEADELDIAALDAWLAEGAQQVAQALREAGPDARVWTFGAEPKAGFWARRMTHETAIHRIDACAASGAEYTVDPVIAADCLDEWLEIVTSPQAVAFRPVYGELPGPGRTLHLHATDTDPGLNAEWFIDATGPSVTWRRAHEKAAVVVRAPMTELLRVFYRRTPVDAPGVEVLGDREVLDFWLERASF
ncbi:maleylpyruvate isomerase family mycothiol-dependent enzyme [Streptomyces cinnamoneus]|uniref:maleylpyruvate isomerase family mycothiol-dependent enzyme n=1 Tax=Streptomyces cinnamoneus TaxID=53446 RepID=UPI0033DB55AF